MSVDWAETLATYGPLVWRTTYRLLHHDAEAEDCCQETFLAAWKWAQRRPVREWPAFLTSLATRRAIDRLRRRTHSQWRVRPLDDVVEPCCPGDDPLNALRLHELMQQVRVAMAELPAKQAEVFWLSCIEDLTHPQIAEQMAISPNQVRVLLHRARARLARLLADVIAHEPKGT